MRALRVVMAVVTAVSMTLIACRQAAPAPSPGPGAGPQFVINSPLDGGAIAGPTFFSVEPFDAAQVQDVTLRAGDAELEPRHAGEDAFRVFLLPSEFPEGPLELSATMTGPGGAASDSVTVEVVHDPPASATVGSGGAVLGAVEANGATSTLTIPPGVADGASVGLLARTQDEVKDATGVDYDALGVTFLGAQEIEASGPLDGAAMVSSGGFGPMVQPGQAVVNYRIAPDADGDGAGELVVVGGASVAPNGDVVSDPPSRLQVASAEVPNGAARTSLHPQQDTSIGGPPGTVLEIAASGLNPASALGNVGVFRGSGGVEVEVPGFVQANEDTQSLLLVLPPLPPGAATLTLRNESTGSTVGPIDLDVEPAVTVDRPSIEIVDEAFAKARTALDRLMASLPSGAEVANLQRASQLLSEQRQQFLQMASDGDAGSEALLDDLAATLLASGLMEGLDEVLVAGDTSLRGIGPTQTCPSPADAADARRTLMWLKVLDLAVLAVTLLACAATGGIPCFAFGVGLAFTAALWGVDWVDRFYPGCDPADPDNPQQGPRTCIPSQRSQVLGQSQGGLSTNQASPPAFTGMGSAVPPGGNGCGSVAAGDDAGGAGLRASASHDSGGRYVVKVSVAGSPRPFAGVTDPGGHFFVPLLPEGQPFTAAAIDTATGDTQTVEGIGPPVGASTFLVFDFFGEVERPNVVRWDGGGDGSSWDDPLNWAGDELPGIADSVLIDVPGEDVTVVHASGTTSIVSLDSREHLDVAGGSLSVDLASTVAGDLSLSGTLTGTGDVTVEGAFRWSDGAMTGAGRTILNGGGRIVGDATKNIRGGRTIENAGALTWSGSGWIRGGEGALLRNLPRASLDIADDATFNGSWYGGERTALHNEGTVTKSAGSGTSDMRVRLGNDGEVHVATGTLQWSGGSDNAGAFTTDAGATLAFSHHEHHLSPTASVAGRGTASFLSGTTTIEGSYDSATSISGGTAHFEAAATSHTLELSGGALAGTGTLGVNDTLTWTGGLMTGSGTTRIESSAQVSGDTTKNMHGGRTVENAGTLTWSGSGWIRGGEGSTVVNLPGALLDITDDAVLNGRWYGGETTTLDNRGTLRKSAGTATTDLRVTLHNSGDVEVDTGTLQWSGDGDATGSFTIAADAALLFWTGSRTLGGSVAGDGTTHVQGGTTTIEGSYGTDTLISGGTLQLDTAANINGLELTGGTLAGSGTLSVTDTLTWTGGRMTGSGTTRIESSAELSGDATKNMSGGRTIDNAGTLTWSGSGWIRGGEDTTVHNLSGALFDVRNDATFNGQWFGGEPTTFSNAGTLRKSAGDDVSDFRVCFQDDGGTVDVQSGMLEINDPCEN